jgi:uncharacterized protein YecE (DUF72 family)
MPSQLGLFGDEGEPRVRACVDDDERAVAARVPGFVRFGTSSWTFPGWAGIVWAGVPSQKDLVASGLRAYAEHPLLRTVGIDRSYYGPLRAADLRAYAEQLPRGFSAVSKVWEEICAYSFPRVARWGERAGKLNPRFLDPDALADVLAPYDEAFAAHAGPFVFELPPCSPEPSEEVLADAIRRLLARAPSHHRYAFELRSPRLLGRAYFDALRDHGAAHCFNFHGAMPTVRRQLELAGGVVGDTVVCRLLLPPGTRYEAMREAYAPFDRIVRAQDEMRDDVVRLAEACERAGASGLFVLVNNKAEGCAPLTVRALAERLARG